MAEVSVVYHISNCTNTTVCVHSGLYKSYITEHAQAHTHTNIHLTAQTHPFTNGLICIGIYLKVSTRILSQDIWNEGEEDNSFFFYHKCYSHFTEFLILLLNPVGFKDTVSTE